MISAIKVPQCLIDYHKVMNILETCDYPLKNKMIKCDGDKIIDKLKHDMKQLPKFQGKDFSIKEKRLKTDQDMGRALFPVEPLPEGALAKSIIKEINSEIDNEIKNVVDLTKEFMTLLLKVEANDEGKKFHPNYISSCRCMDGERMNEIIKELKERLNL